MRVEMRRNLQTLDTEQADKVIATLAEAEAVAKAEADAKAAPNVRQQRVPHHDCLTVASSSKHRSGLGKNHQMIQIAVSFAASATAGSSGSRTGRKVTQAHAVGGTGSQRQVVVIALAVVSQPAQRKKRRREERRGEKGKRKRKRRKAVISDDYVCVGGGQFGKWSEPEPGQTRS
jgi:hypothetical protein